MDVLARIRRANEALQASKRGGAAKRPHGELQLPPAAEPAAAPLHDANHPYQHLLKQSSSLSRRNRQSLVSNSRRSVRFGGDEEGELGKESRSILQHKMAMHESSGASSEGEDTSGVEGRESGDEEEGQESYTNRATSPLFDLPRLLSRKVRRS